MITKVSVLTSVTTLDAAKVRRKIVVQNLGTNPVFVAFDGSTDVTTSSGSKPGVRLDQYETFGWDLDITQTNHAWYAIADGGTSNVSVQYV